MAREPLIANRVQWNNGFEAARHDHRLRSWPCPGKNSPGQNHFNQYSVTETCVRCGLMLNYWPKEGCTGKHRETVPCPHMPAEVTRRLDGSRTEPTKIEFEEALKIVKSEVKLGRTFPSQELDAELSPAPGPGWKNPTRKRNTRRRHL